MSDRRDYGTGSVVRRHQTRWGCPPVATIIDPDTGEERPERPEHDCRAHWYVSVETGWTTQGTRARKWASSKTKQGALRKLRKLQRDQEDGITPAVDPRMTVKAYVDLYLAARQQPPDALSPNAWNAAASAMRRWVVPTLGHKRLATLTPADLRALAQRHYDAGRKTATADATHRALRTMLNHAKADGYQIPAPVLLAKGPGSGISDRTDLTLDDAGACLQVAATLPNGIRWALALLYGARQGETLGLVEVDPVDGFRCIDFQARTITLRWQLQDLQRVDRKRPELGYRIHRDYEAVQLAGMYHLVRPKSSKGYRVLPMIEPIAEALEAWLAVRPENPWGLAFPSAQGGPMNSAKDRDEWAAIQQTAAVCVDPDDERKLTGMNPSWRGHPSGDRWYYIHECRNFAATQLDEAGASDNVIMSLLGHASIRTTRGYMTAHLETKRAAVDAIGQRLALGPGN